MSCFSFGGFHWRSNNGANNMIFFYKKGTRSWIFFLLIQHASNCVDAFSVKTVQYGLLKNPPRSLHAKFSAFVKIDFHRSVSQKRIAGQFFFEEKITVENHPNILTRFIVFLEENERNCCFQQGETTDVPRKQNCFLAWFLQWSVVRRMNLATTISNPHAIWIIFVGIPWTKGLPQTPTRRPSRLLLALTNRLFKKSQKALEKMSNGSLQGRLDDNFGICRNYALSHFLYS